MKKLKKSIYRLILFLLCLVGTGCKSVDGKKYLIKEIEKEPKTKIDITKTLDQFEEAYDATNDLVFLQTVKKVADEMVDHGFEYNTSKIGKCLEDAKEGNLHGDCAHLICWALQDMGILTEKQTFYSKKKGVLSCNKDGKIYSSLEKHATIIEIDPVKGSNQEELKKILKVGDICCYSLHMNVVAGVNKKGNIIYYDGGLTPVKGHKPGGKYTDDLRSPYGRPNMKNTLYTIIRLK